LFVLSESIHLSTPSNTRTGKRIKLESPITSLLASISGQSTTAVRVYHLQILLFFIDRHWLILHENLQNEVIHMLLQFVSYDEGVIQSWVFLCFAAIAHANSSRVNRSSETPGPFTTTSERLPDLATWDSIWTNAIRRVNVPIVCRAACHAAHALLHSHSKATNAIQNLLSSQRVMSEIETLGKDLDVQGPAYPYDSVCAFLAQCMHAASQDMRLYRMHLEEKVLSWLVDSWKMVNMVRRMSLYLVKDIMLLLEGICGLTRRSDLVSRVPLPQCQITDVLTEQAKTKVIRDFLMDAQLPIFRKPMQAMKPSMAIGAGGHDYFSSAQQLIEPRIRERKVSTFLLKSLEALLSDWEGNTSHTTAEKARLCLDVAITALSFESSLILNGTQANRRVVQCACKLISIVTALTADPRWTAGEKALILLGLDPLITTGNEDNSGDGWDGMLPPDVGSGIKTHTLKRLTFNQDNKDATLAAMRMNFLRIIWQNTDVR
jgi:serine-protein kinase ATM